MSRKDPRAELSDDELKLAMPSLRRRRKPAPPAVDEPPPTAVDDPPPTTDFERDDTPPASAEPEPRPEPEQRPDPAPEPEPERTAAPPSPPLHDEDDQDDEDDPALYAAPILSEPEPQPEPQPDPEPQPEPTAAAATSPLVAGFEAARARTEASDATPPDATEPAPEPAPDPAPTPDPDSTAASVPRPTLRDRLGAVPLPALRGAAAVTVAGLVVGLVLALATAGTVQACSVSGGRGSCGAPVLAVLVALFALAVVLGAWLLRRWQVSDAAGTSFIAVGLLATITMLFLIGTLFSWALLLVMPAVSLAGYWVAHLLLTRLDDDTADDDVRR